MIYIFTWNPKKFKWSFLNSGDTLVWSSVSLKPRVGDNFVFLLQGSGKNNGIIGYGNIINYENSVNRRCHYYCLNFRKKWNYMEEAYPETSILKEIFPEQHWSPQGSGTKVKERYENQLLELVENFTTE